MRTIIASIALFGLILSSNIYASTSNDNTRFLGKNPESFMARWKLIQNAKDAIYTQYFIASNDIFGLSFLGLLLKKAREGVHVKLMLDARGALYLARFKGSYYLKLLASEPTAQVKIYNPLIASGSVPSLSLYDKLISNHDKLLIVDHHYLITGGRNISQDYFLNEQDHPEGYADSDVLVRDPEVAKQASMHFLKEFYSKNIFNQRENLLSVIFSSFIEKKLVESRQSMQAVLMNQSKHGKMSKWTSFNNYLKFDLFPINKSFNTQSNVYNNSSRLDNQRQVTVKLINSISQAQSSITLFNPYVVLTPVVESALVDAGQRGVNITIVTNSPVSTDSVLTQAIFEVEWPQIMKKIPNLRIFASKGPRKLHSKINLFDGHTTQIGSYNLDFISQNNNSEVMLSSESKEFNQHVLEYIHQYIQDYCVEYYFDQNGNAVGSEQLISLPDAQNRINRVKYLYPFASGFRYLL